MRKWVGELTQNIYLFAEYLFAINLFVVAEKYWRAA